VREVSYKFRVGTPLLCSLSALAMAVSLSCDESLPVFVPPKNILTLSLQTIEQLNDRSAPPGCQAVRIVLVGENTFDDVYQDSVDIKGSLRIWWKRIPQRYRTIYLTEQNFVNKELIHNGKMLLVPGQQFTMEVFWNLKTDDSLYLATPQQMSFSPAYKHGCDVGILCSDPELFEIESSINIYDRIGYVAAPPQDFIFIGRYCSLMGPFCSCGQ